MLLPEHLRDQLKKPLGVLLLDRDTTKKNISKNIPKDAFVITVGDATTDKMTQFDFNPPLQIVDSVEKRNKRELPKGHAGTTLTCTNPPGEITEESISIIRKALSMTGPVRIVVQGEEDLLVLPVILYGPNNSVVLYGQPNEGLVIVTVTEQLRNRARLMMNSMM